uniref:Major facilitator superfamily domain containing 4Aa n=1 Tax=Hucho hucho TaxID=62062 RepID=A0A4W5NM76_9TELE
MTHWSVFFSFGLYIAFLGPTILDLRCQTQSTLQITWIFFAQQLSLMLGELRCTLSALFVSSLVISVVFAIIPLCHHVLMLAVAMAISGMAMGVIDTIANQQLVKLYQKDSAVLHFFIGLGALVSPLVVDPFLSEGSCVLEGNMTANSSTDLHHLRSSLAEGIITTNISYLDCCEEPTGPQHPGCPGLGLKNPELNMSFCTINPGFGGLLGCCNYGDMKDRPASYFLLYILGGAVLFITNGIIGSYTGFIYTYAVSPPLSLPHKMAGYLTNDQIFEIGVYFKTVGVIVVQCLLLILYSSHVFIFMGTCVLGLFISSVFPCMVALTEDMVNYKGTHSVVTTVLVTSAGTGEMVLQLLTGQLIHSKGSHSFLLVSMISSCIGFTVFRYPHTQVMRKLFS